MCIPEQIHDDVLFQTVAIIVHVVKPYILFLGISYDKKCGYSIIFVILICILILI